MATTPTGQVLTTYGLARALEKGPPGCEIGYAAKLRAQSVCPFRARWENQRRMGF